MEHRTVTWPWTALLLAVTQLSLAPELRADPCGGLEDYTICSTSAWPKFACYGIKSSYGGAIVSLTTDWTYSGGFVEGPYTNCNLVNNGYVPGQGFEGDHGRSIQVDVYRPGQSYPTNCWPCNAGCNWGWNPVQAGSCLTSSSGASGSLQVTQTSGYLYTRTQPLHWDNALGRSNVIIAQRLEFVRWNALKITYTITNNESFTLQDASAELPIAQFEPRLNRAVTYSGNQPWTNAPISTVTVPIQNNTSIDPAPTESWVAWLETYPNDGGDRGVGLHVPFQGNWLVWGLGRVGSASIDPTNFMLVFQTFTLAPGQSRSFIAYLLTGTVEEIRAAVYSLTGH